MPDKELRAVISATPRQRFSSDDLLLYAVTDRSWLRGRTLESCVAAAIAGGATIIQLREKQVSFDELVALAYSIKQICHDAGVLFVIDDNVRAAVAADADGVHVGQDDSSCVQARKMLGPDKIVGVSVQTIAQARAAEAAGADYLGVGALMPTATKPDAAEVTREELYDICHAVSIPVVGIGGLNEQTIPCLAGSGACGAAVVSAIFAAHDCKAAARQWRTTCDQVFHAQQL